MERGNVIGLTTSPGGATLRWSRAGIRIVLGAPAQYSAAEISTQSELMAPGGGARDRGALGIGFLGRMTQSPGRGRLAVHAQRAS